MNRKKRVLFITEATYLNTGYATYSKNIIESLFNTGKYEIAEFSIYGSEEDPRRSTIKWKNYPNIPKPTNSIDLETYNSNPSNQFGEWRFERVCVDFKPDVVLCIRDFWMDAFVYKSPFRRIFKWVWMPTVDGSPQNEEWVDCFCNADGIITYSDWAYNVLKEQSGDAIKYIGTASPTASEHFYPMDKTAIRKEFGLDPNSKIIGTVMRNQRRKLFPVLFKAFSSYLKMTGDKNTFLYCHTSYPDNGWDLGNLLLENEISTRVLFSYICSKCGSLEVSKFNDAIKCCDRCRSFNSTPSNVANGVPDSILAKIYNTFDLYIQCSNSEGFGVPQVEAAACGVPVACTKYSAMEDVIQKLSAFPINLDGKYKELETGCDRAVPSVDSIVEIFNKFFSCSDEDKACIREKVRSQFLQNYSVDKSSSIWQQAIDSLEFADWSIPKSIKSETSFAHSEMTNSSFIDFCCNNYLIGEHMHRSHKIRSLKRDLNFSSYRPSKDGIFSTESSLFGKSNPVTLNRDKVLETFISLAKNSNFWENVRSGIITLERESWLR